MSIASQAMYTIRRLLDHMICKSSSEAAKAFILPSASDSVEEIQIKHTLIFSRSKSRCEKQLTSFVGKSLCLHMQSLPGSNFGGG